MSKILYLTTFILFFSIQDSAFACTSFAVYSNQIFYGMNFDFADFAMKFLISTNGDIKTFHLLFERTFGDVGLFVKTAGMNTKGLFASCQEQHPFNGNPQENKNGNLYVYELYEKIDCSDSIENIEKILEKTKIINMPELNLHNLFADVDGNAFIVASGPDGNAITQMDGKFIVMTNFENHLLDGKSYTEADGMGSDRYIICTEYLQDTIHNFTIDNGIELLHKARNQDPVYATACSMVFDPQNNNVYIFLYCDLNRIYKVDIETNIIEIWKGPTNKHTQPLTIGDEGIMVSDLIKHYV